MLQYLPDMQRAMGGLGVIATTQKPIVKFMIKAWPLTLLAGYAVFVRLKHRYTSKELSAFNVLTDMGFILTPIVGLAMLNKLAEDSDAQQVLAAKMLAQQTQGTAAAATAPGDGAYQVQPVATDAPAYASDDNQGPAQAAPPTDQGGTTPNVQGFGGFGSHLGPPSSPPPMW